MWSMPREDTTSNPAQRLYDILERHSEVVVRSGRNGYNAVWKETLGVESTELTEQIAQAFNLIADVDRALATTGDTYQRKSFDLNKEDWAKPFLPAQSGRSQQIKDGATTEHSRAALGSIASHLRDNLPDGRMPSEEERQDVRHDVEQLIEDVRVDASIPHEVRVLLEALA